MNKKLFFGDYLTMLSIQTHIPEKLTPFIKSFWCLKVDDNLKVPYVEEILPDGHHEIIFSFNSALVRKRNESEGWLHDPLSYFTGQNRKSYLQQLNPGAIIYAIRFHPHTQNLFYNFPASLSTDNLISFSDISPNEMLWNCFSDSPGKTFANLEKVFLEKAKGLKKPEEAFFYTEAAVRKIVKEKGNIKNVQLEKITGVSARHLEKSFQKYVGLSPKQFSNIIKYSYFITYRKNHPEKTLTECAYEAEFHDHSHLIHLSNKITGHSPKSYFGKLNHINNFFLKP